MGDTSHLPYGVGPPHYYLGGVACIYYGAYILPGLQTACPIAWICVRYLVPVPYHTEALELRKASNGRALISPSFRTLRNTSRDLYRVPLYCHIVLYTPPGLYTIIREIQSVPSQSPIPYRGSENDPGSYGWVDKITYPVIFSCLIAPPISSVFPEMCMVQICKVMIPQMLRIFQTIHLPKVKGLHWIWNPPIYLPGRLNDSVILLYSIV